MNLAQFLVHLSDRAIAEPDNYIQPGHNGPYHDPETPVRNRSHWLITLVRAYKITHDAKYLDVVKDLADYLITDEARPHASSFHHRSKDGKDRCNGLIGQAWTIEALACASSKINDSKHADLAEHVFFQHPFISDCGLWNRLEIDGNILSIDSTFNHQLWFAACASLLRTKRHKEIKERIEAFLDALKENLTVLNNGLIYHPIENQFDNRKPASSGLRSITKSLLQIIGIRDGGNHDGIKEKRERMIYKSIGYHGFNMYAFAMLKETLLDHPFWKSPEFGRSVDYLISDEFKNGLSENSYGYPYNPPGYEVPYALSVLTDMSEDELVEISSWWVNEQFRRCYNSETQLMDRNTEDPLTHTARIYELARLPTTILERVEVTI